MQDEEKVQVTTFAQIYRYSSSTGANSQQSSPTILLITLHPSSNEGKALVEAKYGSPVHVSRTTIENIFPARCIIRSDTEASWSGTMDKRANDQIL
jgi:hypothetical protein